MLKLCTFRCWKVFSITETIILEANTRRWPVAGLIMVHRLRRWTSIKSAAGQRLVLAGTCHPAWRVYLERIQLKSLQGGTCLHVVSLTVSTAKNPFFFIVNFFQHVQSGLIYEYSTKWIMTWFIQITRRCTLWVPCATIIVFIILVSGYNQI